MFLNEIAVTFYIRNVPEQYLQGPFNLLVF